MGEQPQLAPEVESRFFHWKQGTLVLGCQVLDVLADVAIVIRTDLRLGGRSSGVLRMAMNPVVEGVQGPGGAIVQVQTFRYRDFDGAERMLTMCACCGDVARCDREDLAEFVRTGCRKCGMEVSAVGFLGPCCNWHTFGSCLKCKGGGDVEMPLGGLVNARAQSGPAHNAGPSATEQGSVLETRVVPVDPNCAPT